MRKEYILLLILAVGVMIGYTYALDTPQALEMPLRQEPYNFTSTQFNLIYFATFILIGPLSIPLGIAIDRFPIKRTLMILLLCSFLSQLTIGLMFQFRPTYYKEVVMAMRSIFGLAGEGMFVLQCLIVTIFGKEEYEFLMGASLALPFFFDAVNSLITTSVYDATHNLPATWYIGSGICLISVICGIVLNVKIIGEENQERNQALQNHQEKQKSCFREVKELSIEFWVIFAAIFFAQACMGPFNDNLNELLIRRFGISYATAGQLLLIPNTVLTILTFLFGKLLRENPQIRRISIAVAAVMHLTTITALYFLPNATEPSATHYVMTVIFLLSIAIFATVYYASLTTSIPFLVKNSVLGTAWGFAGCAVGLSQCILPALYILIMGRQSNLVKAFTDLNFFGVGVTFIYVLLALWIFFRDYQILDTKYSETNDEQESKSSGSNRESLIQSEDGQI